MVTTPQVRESGRGNGESTLTPPPCPRPCPGSIYDSRFPIPVLGVRQHFSDALLVRLGHERRLGQPALAAGGLLRQDVTLHRLGPLELSGSGLPEPLRGAAVRL